MILVNFGILRKLGTDMKITVYSFGKLKRVAMCGIFTITCNQYGR